MSKKASAQETSAFALEIRDSMCSATSCWRDGTVVKDETQVIEAVNVECVE